MKKSDSVLIFAKNIDYGYTFKNRLSEWVLARSNTRIQNSVAVQERKRESEVHTCSINQTNEPRHEKTNILHMRKRKRRSASR